jgi:LPS sulfotransferase NodH
MTPRCCYIICSAPRSGSHLFSNLMADTQLAGYPQEHFNPWHMGHARDEFPERLVYDRSYVNELIEKYTTPNGVFGTKAQFTQITNFVGLGRLEGLFPAPLRYIYVQRLDDERQAVSLARATQTGQYVWDQPVGAKPKYNYHQISQCLREIKIQEKGWEVYFLERQITPFRVVYEQFVEDVDCITIEALRFLDVQVPAGFQVPPPRMRKQADYLSEEWVTKFQHSVR